MSEFLNHHEGRLTQDDVDIIMRDREQLGRKFTRDDFTPQKGYMRAIAYQYIHSYTGNFEWLVQVKEDVDNGGRLFDGAYAGILNCIVNSETRFRGNSSRKRNRGHESKPADAELMSIPSAGIYTVAYDNAHITLRVKQGNGSFEGRMVVEVLIGPDNTHDYIGFADVKEDGIRFWSKRRNMAKASRAEDALRVLTGSDREAQKAYGKAYAMKSGNCWKCGRVLTDPESIQAGVGPICRDLV